MNGCFCTLEYWKKCFLKNEKMVNRKVRKVGNLGKIILSFLISEFWIFPYSQNRKLGFEILGKKFLRFSRFPSFWPGQRRSTGTGQRRRYQLYMTNYHTKTEKDNAPKSVEHCQSCGISICWEHSVQVFHGCLQWNFIFYFRFSV